MSIDIEGTIDSGRFSAGKDLFEFLNELGTEQKNAVIGYRCVATDLPDDIGDDLQYVEFETTLRTLAQLGVCFIGEDEFKELLSQVHERYELFGDHRAWSILTVIEICEYLNFSDSHIEATIYQNNSRVNKVGIDLVGENDHLELFTCKFNISKQHKEAKKKGKELRDVSDSLNVDSIVGLGTLSVQVKDRIESRIGSQFDKVITGRDILDFSG